MSSKSIDKFSKEGYSEVYGARPFKRLIGNESVSAGPLKVSQVNPDKLILDFWYFLF